MLAKKSQVLFCVDFLCVVELPGLVWGLLDGFWFLWLFGLIKGIILVCLFFSPTKMSEEF